MAEVIDPIVHELLRDIRELTSSRLLYEDPWHGFVPMDGAPSDCQIGPPIPFGDLGRRDRADVIDTFIRWDQHSRQGLDWRDADAIRNNIADGKPPHQWLGGTSFRDPALRAQRRAELIQETFELSREIGYAHFRAEHFDRPDPALVRLGPEEREAFLREWWDGARQRMYESYREQVASLNNEQLARSREAYKLARDREAYKGPMADGGRVDTSEKTSCGEDAITATLRDQLFTPAQPEPQPQPEHPHERPHKR
jgi:hypothetical protein